MTDAAHIEEREDQPLTLKEACSVYFRDRIKVASLRAEAARGRLDTFRVGRTDFTTLKDLREMERRCRAEKQARASTSTENGDSGLSETARASSARAALNETVQALKDRSRSTSATNTSRRLARNH